MNVNLLKKKIFVVIFILAVIGIPLLSCLSATHGGAYAIAANHGYASVDGAVIIGTAVNVGWALGLLCGVQLVVGLVVAG